MAGLASSCVATTSILMHFDCPDVLMEPPPQQCWEEAGRCWQQQQPPALGVTPNPAQALAWALLAAAGGPYEYVIRVLYAKP